jgi:hypothetical protein
MLPINGRARAFSSRIALCSAGPAMAATPRLSQTQCYLNDSGARRNHLVEERKNLSL